MLVSVRLYLVHLDLPEAGFKSSARNSVQHKKSRPCPDSFLRSAPHSKTSVQMCTTITLPYELDLQKHLNASLRKVIIRTFTPERFLNFRCPTVSDFLRF